MKMKPVTCPTEKGPMMFIIPADIDEHAYLAQPYVQAKIALFNQGVLTADNHQNLEIEHEKKCPILKGKGLCNCNPTLRMRTVH